MPEADKPRSPGANLPGIARVKHIIAVASGKGGVGKTTVAVNLALALSRRGQKVGLLDADIYGPSVPVMLGLQARPVPAEGMMRPVDRYGLAVMSVGFLIEEDQPVIWRGPMVSKVLTEFLGKVDWGERDFLVVDLPPGTGDPSITVARTLPGAAVVMVTTPQAVALADVRRAVLMFRRLGTPVLGVVENMAYFCCAHSAERIPIFGSGCGDALSEELGLPLLASLPIDMALRESGGAGTPLLITEPDAPISCSFTALAARVASILKAGG